MPEAAVPVELKRLPEVALPQPKFQQETRGLTGTILTASSINGTQTVLHGHNDYAKKKILPLTVSLLCALSATAFEGNRLTTNSDAAVVTTINTLSTAAAQAVVATNIPQSSLYSSNSAQLGGNLPSYYAAASNTVSTVVDSNGVYTVSGTNAPFAFPGGVGSSIPVQAVFVTSGRAVYNNSWFTNGNTTPASLIKVGTPADYFTNVLYNGSTWSVGGWTLGGGAGGAFVSGGAATNANSLFGFYGTKVDATASNTFVYAYPQMSAAMYLPNNTNTPPPLMAIPAGGCFIQCSNSEVWFIFNTNATEISVHLP